jgi:hypothetical protein
MTQSIAQGTETGKYNCIGKNNKFNSGVSKIVNQSIWKMLTVITTLAFLILSRWFYIKVFAEASQKMNEKNSALTATLITLLFYAFAFPASANIMGPPSNLRVFCIKCRQMLVETNVTMNGLIHSIKNPTMLSKIPPLS